MNERPTVGTPTEIADRWYNEEETFNAIKAGRTQERFGIPDIYSREFAGWLTEQWRLAMVKGIQIGREE